MMRQLKLTILAALVTLLAMPGAPVPAAPDPTTLSIRLQGFEEVPAISTTGTGRFRIQISKNSIEYELSYDKLEGGAVLQAHIHIGQRSVNGGIVLFLCSNLPSPPPGTPACPTPSGTVSGTLDAGDVRAVPSQGIAVGEFDEVLRAIRSGVAYANVHTVVYPGGEIRGQLERRRRRGDD